VHSWRWSFFAPEPVGIFCLISFRVAVGVRPNEDPSRDLKKTLEEKKKKMNYKISKN
jgi:hypothetical protein